jgi:hypothetical protein
VLRIAISGHHEPDGIEAEALQALHLVEIIDRAPAH